MYCCIHCGYKNNKDNNYCENCGKKIELQNNIEAEKGSNKTLQAIGLILLFTCIFVVIWKIFFNVSIKYFLHNTNQIKYLGLIFIPILSIVLTKSILDKKTNSNKYSNIILGILVIIFFKPLIYLIYCIITSIVLFFSPNINWAQNLVLTGPISIFLTIVFIISIVKHANKDKENKNDTKDDNDNIINEKLKEEIKTVDSDYDTNTSNNTISKSETATNSNFLSSFKGLLFFPITFIYFILIAIIIYFGCGESTQQVSWVFALIIDPPLSIVLGIITTIGIMKESEEQTDETNNEINQETENNKVDIQIDNINNNDINKQIISNKSKKKMSPESKVLIVSILSPTFAIIIFYLVGGLASIIQDIFKLDFFAYIIEDNITTFIGICIILGIIFALAAVTDVPEEEKETNKNETNKN